MKKYNLTDLLDGFIETKIDNKPTLQALKGIEIPIIQRDYAQGREEEKPIRKRFLVSIFEALRENKELELDFVYGSIKSIQGENVFLPLDGQQRLTTLYLLYWLVINKEELADEKQKDIRSRLSRFRYATRASSSAFCEKLAQICIRTDVREYIENSSWFYKSYQDDPTVQAMLTMLSELETKYHELNIPVFDRLSNLSFYILSLGDFNLTDELYITMNARGKTISHFENFKADLIGFMKEDKNEKNITIDGIEIPYSQHFATQIDTVWTDIFWPTAKKQEAQENKIVDPYFFHFITRYLLNNYIAGYDGDVLDSPTYLLLSHVADKNGDLVYEEFDTYKKGIDMGILRRLEKVLNNLSLPIEKTSEKISQRIQAAIQPLWNIADPWTLFNKDINQRQRILFHAVCCYLEKNTYDDDKFKDWVRVVWNVIIDPANEGVEAMIAAIKFFSKLSVKSQDIISFLKESNFKPIQAESNTCYIGDLVFTDGFMVEQLKEEQTKALRFGEPFWKEQIYRAESHPLFQGNIGFLINDASELSLFRRRVNNSYAIFASSGVNKDFRTNYGAFRYIISQLSTWHDIDQFKYDERPDTWRRRLRRDKISKGIITNLCSLENENAIKNVIQSAICQPSTALSLSPREIVAHFHLYGQENFIEYILKIEKEIKFRDRYGHLFLYKKGSQDNGQVMIDCYRNQVIDQLCKLESIQASQRCGNSDIFNGLHVVLTVIRNGEKITVTFGVDMLVQLHLLHRNGIAELIHPDLLCGNKMDNAYELNLLAPRISTYIHQMTPNQ